VAEAGPPELSAIPRRILRTTVTANALGAGLVYLYLQFLAPGAYDPRSPQTDGVVSLAVMALYMTLSVAVITRLLRALLVGQADLASPGETAEVTDEQRRQVLGVPGRVGWLTAGAWVGAAGVFGVLNAAFGNPAVSVARVTVGILLGGLVTAPLTATLVERGLRPVFALVLANHPGGGPGRAALAIRARLLRAWLLGSAVPLVSIGLTPVARTSAQRSDLVVPIAFLAGLGLVAGFVMSTITASAVSEPLRTLRRAVDAVRDGDLAVQVPVDDAGEIGMLEAGVNDMVVGLRERRALEDLFGRHVGEEVARQALAHGAALGGQVREVSVLFIDVIGSTALASTRPAGEVVELLNAFFATVVGAVTEEGGWVNKFEGDAALCVFGAPGDQADHATRALAAARALRDRLSAGGPGSELDAAIGVATGSAVAGNVGALDRYEYTVIGDPVNEAARLSEQAKAMSSRLVASEAAVAAAGPAAGRWYEAGEVVLRGRAVPTRLMEPAPLGDQPPATAGTIDTV